MATYGLCGWNQEGYDREEERTHQNEDNAYYGPDVLLVAIAHAPAQPAIGYGSDSRSEEHRIEQFHASIVS